MPTFHVLAARCDLRTARSGSWTRERLGRPAENSRPVVRNALGTIAPHTEGAGRVEARVATAA